MALTGDLDDQRLLREHRAGDVLAFAHIVARHRRALHAHAARRLGDPALAEDAVQETLLRAFRHLHRFEGEQRLDAWLHRILTNACHDIGRRLGRESKLFDKACTVADVDAPPADDLLELLPDEEVSDALDEMPAAYREALVLRFVEELSYDEVAEAAGISPDNARARVSRGRHMLRRLLSGPNLLFMSVALGSEGAAKVALVGASSPLG